MVAQLKDRARIKAEEWLSRLGRALENFPEFSELLKHKSKLKYPALFLVGLLTADLLLQLGTGMIAQKGGGPKAPPPDKIEYEKAYVKGRQTFEEVIRRSPFCPGCPVPDIIEQIRTRPKDCAKAKILANSSSLKVIGTIVLSDPTVSVATITQGSAESKAIKKGDTVDGFGTVFEIRRNRICFEKSDGFLGYVDIPDEPVTFGQPIANALTKSLYDEIENAGDNTVVIKKNFLLEKLNDPNILFQAQAVPYKDPATGVMKGFKVLNIVPGSVYEAMDIRGEDIIVEVNGEPMNSLSKAQELYASAGSASEVVIGILRGGQPVKKVFKVK